MRESSGDRSPADASSVDVWVGVATAGLVGWFCATAAANLPQRTLDRVRRLDPTGRMLPNWRFFAPTPVSHDYELVYRVHRVPGQSPGWEAGLNATRRRWSHAIWFPARRREKAFSDLAVRLADLAASGPAHRLRSAPSYRVVQGLAEAVMRDRLGSSGAPVRWQFAILRHGGYDVDEEPQLVFVSDIHGAPTGQPSAARVLKR